MVQFIRIRASVGVVYLGSGFGQGIGTARTEDFEITIKNYDRTTWVTTQGRYDRVCSGGEACEIECLATLPNRS